ncbi:adenylate cyclase [Pelomyxa schiedti]|nr:adenylate cyclase [Pelomyxa schiedti]
MKALLGSHNKISDSSVSLGMSPSASSIHLVGIGTPIDYARVMNKSKTAGVCSLMVVVPVVAVSVVTLIVLSTLAPMTALWVKSLDSLSGTCTTSIYKEIDVYRTLLVEKSVTALANKMNVPPIVAASAKIAIPESVYLNPLPLGVDPTGSMMIIRGLASQYPTINNMCAGWVNAQGAHLYTDSQTYWGWYDSNINATPTFCYIDDGIPTFCRRKPNALTNYNLTIRAWWQMGLTAWEGAWTSVYSSSNPLDGRVIAYTLRASATQIAVIQVAYSIKFLETFFTSLNLTEHGVAFLVETGTLKLIAGSVGVQILTPTNGDIYAPNSPDLFVAAATQQWVNDTGGTPAERHMEVVLNGTHSFIDVAPIRANGGLVLWLFLITPEEDFLQDIDDEQDKAVDHAYFLLWVLLGVELAIGVAAVGISVSLSLFLARSLSAVSQKLQKVSRGQLSRRESSTELRRSMLREIDTLNSEVTIMQSALDSFSQYVPTQVVRYLCKNRMKPVVGVTQMHCTVMFLDVVDFTQKMEQYGAQVIIQVLSTMFESFSSIVTKNRGCIDKYIGDAIMALWGCPMVDPTSELNACRAVAEIMADVDRLNCVFKSKSLPEMHIRIGLHSGEVNAGNVGSSQRLNFTVLGNTVNLASRLEPLNKELATSVLVSDTIRNTCSVDGNTMFSYRALGHIQVRGFKEPILVHEFLGFTSKLPPATQQMLHSFSIVDKILCKKVTEATPATDALETYLEENPDDFTAIQARKFIVHREN